MFGAYYLGQEYFAGMYDLQIIAISRKRPTLWRRNVNKDASIDNYSSPLATYDSLFNSYGSDTATLADNGKIAGSWRRKTKQIAAWDRNSLATANLTSYNSSNITYNSADSTYDSIVPDEDFSDRKAPTVWKVN